MDDISVARMLEQHAQWLESGEVNGVRADFSGANLDGRDLAGVDLSGAVLRGASLNGSQLRETQLVHADLQDATLVATDLSGANLMLSDFSGADLAKANLSHTSTATAGLSINMRRGPRFQDANLRGANLHKCYCYMSEFSGARLAGANFSEAMLERANLSSNTLADLVFRGANLTDANLQDSDLSGADLHGAMLSQANFSRSNLTNADITAARLNASNLDEAQVDGIRYDRKTLFRGTRVGGCYGSSRFRRYAQDQDYIEEFKQTHPAYYWLWYLLTDCGRSLVRVVLWSISLIFLFATLFFFIGEAAFNVGNKETLGWNFFTTLYYSVVTFTTLGFGDITPRTTTAAVAVMVEVVVGYLMLGILISILANKVARRS